MNELTDSLVTFAQYVETLMRTNAVSLNVMNEAIFYGEQDTVPYTPTICVDADNKRNEYAAAQRLTDVHFTVHVIIYHSKFTSASDNALGSDMMAEEVERLLHADPTCGGLVLDSHVTVIESGYAQRENTIYRTSRLTFVGRSRTRLPAAGWNQP